MSAATTAAAGPSTRRRSLSAAASSPVALAAGFAVVAVVAVTTSSPGRYVGENRVDQYISPGHRLVRSAFLWDPTRGLGRTREDLWPVQLVPLSLLRGIGLSPVAAQRAFHALLLVTAAAGAAAVLRTVRALDASRSVAQADAEAGADGAGIAAPVLAGAVYAFGPYAATFLTPANLFASYALAPWVVLCALRGPSSHHRWRWAAVAALLVAALGNADLPGVVMALAVVPLVAVWSGRHVGLGLRAGLGWLARAGLLVVGLSAAALWKTAAAAAVFGQRLSSTEAPATVGAVSSWSETWRGLGFWLSYYRGPIPARPQTADLFTDPAVVLATFVAPVLALVALALPEVRTRVVWAAGALLSAVLMVGVHPVDDPVPLGRAVQGAFDASATLSGFRTTYKAGAGLMLGVAVLAASAVDALSKRAGRGPGRALLAAGVALLVGVAGLPFWTGNLYDGSRTSGPVPAYWREAAQAVNALPGDGRVLVLPASTRTVYSWGWVGDDILDALITRPHAVDTSVPLSTAEAADILAAVSSAVDEARHRPGGVAAVLRRLGIDHVLIRNDIDADQTRTLSPNRLARLRSDPSLRRIRSFGAPPRSGQATASSRDTEGDDRPRLELFRVVDPGPTGPRLAPDSGALVVSGSGDVVLDLGAEGDLDRSGTVRFSGGLDPTDLRSALSAGGRLVLSDTNRRRVSVVNGLVRDESWTLAAGEDLDRDAGALFDRPGSQTVAWYRDATRISASGVPRSVRGTQASTRPAAAFDGRASTWWQTVETRGQVGLSLRVDLRRAERLGTVRLDPLPAPPSTRRLTSVVVRTAGGSRRVDLRDGAAAVTLDAEPTDWVEVEVAAVSDGAPRAVGLREVEIEGLDLTEWIALPDDVARAARRDRALARIVEDAPLSVLVSRTRPGAAVPVERVLRRRVRLPSDVDATVSGSVTPVDPQTVTLLAGLRGECGGGDGALTIDGESVALTLADAEVPLLVGAPVDLRSCDRVALRAGWREVEVDAALPLDRLRLDTAGIAEVDPPSGSLRQREVRPDRLRVEVDAPDGAVVLTGQSHDPRWVATVDGRDLGPASLHDGQSGWTLPAGDDLDVVMEFRPARRFRLAAGVSLATAAVCLALVVRRPRPRGGRGGDPAATGQVEGGRTASDASSA